jgi:SAM-dependent methyltransferase
MIFDPDSPLSLPAKARTRGTATTTAATGTAIAPPAGAISPNLADLASPAGRPGPSRRFLAVAARAMGRVTRSVPRRSVPTPSPRAATPARPGLGRRLCGWSHDTFFQAIHRHRLVYNACWEDPRIDRELLALGPDSRVVMITSAGCNALDYLLDDPAEIHAVDVNPRQNAVLELKLGLLERGDHADLFRLFSEGRHPEIGNLLDALNGRLGPVAARFWRDKHHYLDGRTPRGSFYFHGSSGDVAWLMRTFVLRRHPRLREQVEALLEARSLAEQRRIFDELEPRLWNGFSRWLVRQHPLPLRRPARRFPPPLRPPPTPLRPPAHRSPARPRPRRYLRQPPSGRSPMNATRCSSDRRVTPDADARRPDQEAGLRRYYALHARLYDATRWTFLFGRTRLIGAIARRLEPRHILEIGCGTGVNLARLATRFPNARLGGWDGSPDMLARARRRLGVLGDRCELRAGFFPGDPPPDPAPDLILFSYCLSMINPGWETAIEAARDQLAPGGHLAVVDFHGTRFAGFRRWMRFNHVRLERHLLPGLRAAGTPVIDCVRPAWGGVWEYFFYLGA